MADVVSIHQVTSMFESIGRAARHQLLDGNQLRDLQIDTGRSVFGNRANDVALSEHAYRGIAFSPDDILDHQRADVAGPHQLGGNADCLVHANGRDTGSFLAQNVSDLHGNLHR